VLFILLEGPHCHRRHRHIQSQGSASYTGVFSIAGPLGPAGTAGFSQYPYNSLYDMGRVVYLKYPQQFF
jgi:hypothetical protein